jgi:hypothetical protein
MFNKKINIWIDEADDSINLWSKYEQILAMRIINQVTLVSATFDSVMSKYKSLSVLPYLQTHPECYRGLRSATRCEVNFVGSAPEYVKRVIETNAEKLIKPGMRAFIPGSIAKVTHNAIADFLHKEHGFVVIIINGERKEILVPNHEPIDLRCYLTVESGQVPTEFNTQLAKLYKENNWARFPLAITGFYCVERGVTFQCGPEEGVHDGFMFDYGIIPPIACAAEAYQTMARLFGNVGHIAGYKAVDVYTNAVTFSRVERQEEIAINIARMVAEQKLENVDKKDLKAAQNFDLPESEAKKKQPIKTDTDKEYREFDSQDDAIEFAKTIGGKLRKRSESADAPAVAPKELQTHGKNPSCEDLFKRMWGMNKKSWIRMTPTCNNKWCVYWRPSLRPTTAEQNHDSMEQTDTMPE